MKNRVLYAVWGMLMFAGATMQVVAATVVYDAAEPIVSFSVNSLDFGSLDVGGMRDPLSVRLSNTGSAALDISHLYATSAIFSQTNNCNNYVPSGGNCTINVTFIPTAAQNHTENLTVISDAIGSPHTVSLTGRGGDGSTQTKSTGAAVSFGSTTSSAEPIVSFSVNSLDFGSLDVGGMRDPLSVRLSNTGSAALDISHLYATSAIFSQTNNCNNYVPSGGNCTINVTFIPTAAQNHTENLTVISDAIGSPHTVSLTGRGGDGSTQTKSTGSAGNYVLHVNFENRVANTPYTESQIIQDFNANSNDGPYYGLKSGNIWIVSDPVGTGRGNVLRVHHPAGEFAKGGASFKARFAPDNENKSGSARFDDVYFAYDIYLSPNTKRMPYHKLPGLITGTLLEASHPGGETPVPEGIVSFTASMATFTSLAWPSRPDGTMLLYYYDALRVQANNFLDTTDPTRQTAAGSYAQPLGKWITIEQRVKLNTADSNNAYNSTRDLKDGLVEVWIDGVKMSSKVHLWRYTNTMKVDGFWFYDYYNHVPHLISPPRQDQHVYYDNFKVSTTPITH